MKIKLSRLCLILFARKTFFFLFLQKPPLYSWNILTIRHKTLSNQSTNFQRKNNPQNHIKSIKANIMLLIVITCSNCRYGVKHYPINQSTFSGKIATTKNHIKSIKANMLLLVITCFKWETLIIYNIKNWCGIPPL